MDNTKNKLADLRTRALKRSISFSNIKDEKDAKFENDFFELAKNNLYKQIGAQK